MLPFSVLGALEPAAALVSWCAIGTLAVLVLADAALTGRSLAGISVQLPPLARMSKDRKTRIEVRIGNESKKAATLRLALGWPREFHAPVEDLFVQLPAGTEWSRTYWECLPLKRGQYRLETARVEIRSPLGFWAVRKVLPAKAEIRVYPNLLFERKNLAALFLHRGAFGLHAQRQVGKGREFEKLREYLPGDSFDEIHWKATAKHGRPITKVFQIERTQEVYVVLDASRLSARATNNSALEKRERGNGPELHAASGSAIVEPLPSTTALERFVTATLVLGLAAQQQGDLFGLLAFSDKVEKFLRAQNGQAHYGACREALYALAPRSVSPDFDEVCSFVRLRLRRRALVIFLTALDDPVLASSFVRNMDLIRRQHLVVVNMLQTPGVAPAFSNAEVEFVDDLYEQLGGHLLWQNLRELEKVLNRRGVRFSLLPDERLSVELVSQYLNVKRRQAL